MDDPILQRIEREAGLPGLIDALAERLAPADLQSLLLAVAQRRASARPPVDRDFLRGKEAVTAGLRTAGSGCLLSAPLVARASRSLSRRHQHGGCRSLRTTAAHALFRSLAISAFHRIRAPCRTDESSFVTVVRDRPRAKYGSALIPNCRAQ